MKPKTNIEFIIKVFNRYRNPNNRAATPAGCQYLTNDGRKCAVGIAMRDGDWQEFGGSYTSILNMYDKKQVLKEEYMEIDEELFNELQRWHDAKTNFTSDSLSLKGMQKIKDLMWKYYTWDGISRRVKGRQIRNINKIK